MQIHVVRPGQTLYGIAQTYSVTVDRLVESNKIPNPNNLVSGQALVIPIVGSYYFVQPGDSLYSISQRVDVPVQELANINGISENQILSVGYRLYIPARRKRTAEFNGYVEPRGTTVAPALVTAAREAAPYLTYLAPFSFQALRDGSLKEPLLDDFPAIARENKNVLMMVITNQENDQFSDELGRIILTNTSVQNKFLNNIVTTAKKYGFRDIHFDFEYLRPADREAYNQFLRKARDRFKKEGWFISTALAPKTSAEQKGRWYEAHDYKAHGEIVDFVIIMTYEWGYSGGPPMAVSPIGPVRDVLEYAVTDIPSNKILMGQNLYGYDWTLPFVQGSTARAVSPQQAIQIAADNDVSIEYDETAQAPHFNYTDIEDRQHEVWFEDARSIQAKFDLLKELNLRGMSYWKLGLAFPQNWLLISDNFNVRRRV
ncbi:MULTISPECIES: glycosyl hydrolase family 18 protein [Peribacillus]|uniref:Glycoside hydrolase family 18 protein n=1 Tax=Peribacillus castrilensis TaxID=2897690 RepID=A0AAW9N6L2_9BACI|nr:glycoside hydrolase family 18 protein [Peribacillus frigoritolerans]MEC0272023.1 glycoside hydrolase family 18 protein [Peribacillus castrilensis]MDM5312003.1 glycoside hydrolase family 18 protein [Peribacillus frigoritolerans]MEC0296766.1 glycoside hydrolase family 18 protein [Peribacillus castrilensis]MEC0346642.1 glycoside hydrolase family 18 protein [Peribacillus castrilensis]TFH61563.1 LysM peptidoglycan-binding domain-containing protein [Peribacillus frigoritolerans]